MTAHVTFDKVMSTLSKSQKALLTHYLLDDENGHYHFLKPEVLSILNELKIIQNKNYQADLILKNLRNELVNRIPFKKPATPEFEFIDLFAGIGGFRMALQELNGNCVYTSEWDEKAQITYSTNYGEYPFGDISSDEVKSFIPKNYDLLCAGFPCQAFSIAGRRGGFEDTRGTLFFEVAKIIQESKPKAVLLENVKGLVNHDRGKTLRTIINVLENDLKYYVIKPSVLNAKDYGVPQNRERILIVAFKDKSHFEAFEYPRPIKSSVSFKNIKEKSEVSVKYYLSQRYLDTLRAHKERHASKGNGFGYEVIGENDITNAIVCGGMGRERNLVYDDRLTNFKPITNIKGPVNNEFIRKMTPREWARLQGFPDEFIIPVSDSAAYKQFGNSVAVPVIKECAKKIIESICF